MTRSAPGRAERDADVGALQRRGVVDPVAGHGDRVAPVLEPGDECELLVRGHSGIHADVGRLVGHAVAVQVGTRHRARGVDPHLPGDRASGRRMVPGGHQQRDTSGACQGDGSSGVVPRGVAQRDQRDRGEVSLGSLDVLRDDIEPTACQCEHALAAVGVLIGQCKQPVGADAEAPGQDLFRCPLAQQPRAVLERVHSAHASALGGERGGRETGVCLAASFGIVGGGELQQRPLGGVAAGRIERRVVAEHRDVQQRVEGSIVGVDDERGPVRCHDAGNPHPVLGDRPGLVHDEHVHRAERLDRREPPDDRAPPCHPTNPERQRDAGDRRQTLRDRCDRERNRGQEGFVGGPAAASQHDQQERARRDGQRRATKPPGEAGQLSLQWCGLALDL